MVRRDLTYSHEWTDDELREWFHWFHERVSGWTVTDDNGVRRTISNVEMALYNHAAHVVRQDLQTAAEIADFLQGIAHDKQS